jgi:hypothetical protein
VKLALLTCALIVAVACGKSDKDAKPSAKEHPSDYELAKRKQTLLMTKQYVEAYAHWSVENPSAACPQTIAELEKYSYHPSDGKDPWGTPFVLSCSDKDFVVSSNGPDGKPGTDDDIKSTDNKIKEE